MIDLLAYATGTRWFGSQPARLLDTSVSRWWVAPRGRDHVGVRSAFLDVSFGAEPLRFHIPLGYVAPGTSESTALAQESIDGLEYDVVDATDDHRCRLALFQALADGGDGFEVVSAFSPEGLATRRFGGEQSNTTIVLGDAVMMKVFFAALRRGLTPTSSAIALSREAVPSLPCTGGGITTIKTWLWRWNCLPSRWTAT